MVGGEVNGEWGLALGRACWLESAWEVGIHRTWGLMRKEPKGDTVWEFPDGPEMRTRSSHC